MRPTCGLISPHSSTELIIFFVFWRVSRNLMYIMRWGGGMSAAAAAEAAVITTVNCVRFLVVMVVWFGRNLLKPPAGWTASPPRPASETRAGELDDGWMIRWLSAIGLRCHIHNTHGADWKFHIYIYLKSAIRYHLDSISRDCTPETHIGTFYFSSCLWQRTQRSGPGRWRSNISLLSTYILMCFGDICCGFANVTRDSLQSCADRRTEHFDTRGLKWSKAVSVGRIRYKILARICSMRNLTLKFNGIRRRLVLFKYIFKMYIELIVKITK